MRAPLVVWHGDMQQAYELAAAVARHCDCRAEKRQCGGHAAMLEQRFIDGVLYGRWMVERMINEEWRVER